MSCVLKKIIFDFSVLFYITLLLFRYSYLVSYQDLSMLIFLSTRL